MKNGFAGIVRRIFPLIIALSAGSSYSAYARDVIFGKAKETLPVAFGVETLFRFPLEVKTVTEASRFDIHPANQESPDYSVLSVKPRLSEGSADVTFILSDGTTIRTLLLITNRPALKKDSIYDFKPKDELPDSNPNLQSKREPLVISELDLMRAMIRGEQVSGFDVSRFSRSIPIGSPHLSAELVKVYQGHDLSGYVYLLKTEKKDKHFEISIKDLAIGQPNLAILAQIDSSTIGGETPADRQAFLRVVAKPGATSHKMILPVAIRGDSTTKAEDK